MKQRTKKEYIEHPCECPFCGSDEITGGHVEIQAREANQTVQCIICEKRWIDIYKLVGFEEVK